MTAPTDGGGSDPGMMRTVARRDGDACASTSAAAPGGILRH